MTDHFGFALDLDTKAVTEQGEFSGYASVFGNQDAYADVMMPGAFKKTLQARPPSKVKMLRQHSFDEPIGIWTDLVEDKKGLRAKGKLILDTTKGRETYALLKAGALDALSIGFRTTKDHFDRTKGIRYIDEVDLREISIVMFPANPRTTVSTVKDDSERARALVQAINRATEALRS